MTHQIYHVFGIDVSRQGGLQHIEGEEEPCLVYAAGNSLVFLGLSSSKRQYLLSCGDRGVGSHVVHPSHKYIAVGETGLKPNIYIYDFPKLKISKVLQGGAARSFSCMCFSHGGHKLATVSSSPDFMLTIWSWIDERMLLHSKVSHVTFYLSHLSSHRRSGRTFSACDFRLATKGA